MAVIRGSKDFSSGHPSCVCFLDPNITLQITTQRVKMDSPSSEGRGRGRPRVDPPVLLYSGHPYLLRRESSLSQDGESDVFEDAREEWDQEPVVMVSRPGAGQAVTGSPTT